MRLLIINTKQPKVERCWGSARVVQSVTNALVEGGLHVSIANADTRQDVVEKLGLLRPDLVFANGYRLLGSPGAPYITEVLDSLSTGIVWGFGRLTRAAADLSESHRGVQLSPIPYCHAWSIAGTVHRRTGF